MPQPFFAQKKIRMTTHILERREQLTGGGEPPALQDWRNTLKHAQELRLKLRNQRAARCSAPARAEERQEESCETLRESHERHRLAGADRERAARGGGAACQQENR